MAMDFQTMHSFPGMAFPMRCSNDGDDEEMDDEDPNGQRDTDTGAGGGDRIPRCQIVSKGERQKPDGKCKSESESEKCTV